jgi:hypothetical protein
MKGDLPKFHSDFLKGDAMTTNNEQCAADGAWLRLDSLELAAWAKLEDGLKNFESAFQDTYEAALSHPYYGLRLGKQWTYVWP